MYFCTLLGHLYVYIIQVRHLGIEVVENLERKKFKALMNFQYLHM